MSWRAGRWDTDPRHAYVANIGDDAAYEVSVMASNRVIGTAQRVPPYSADRLSSSSAPPCYVNFCIHELLRSRVSFTARSVQEKDGAPDQFEVVVQVRWRSEDGEWFTQSARTD